MLDKSKLIVTILSYSLIIINIFAPYLFPSILSVIFILLSSNKSPVSLSSPGKSKFIIPFLFCFSYVAGDVNVIWWQKRQK